MKEQERNCTAPHSILLIRTKIPLLRAQTPNHSTTFPKMAYKGDLEAGDHDCLKKTT